MTIDEPMHGTQTTGAKMTTMTGTQNRGKRNRKDNGVVTSTTFHCTVLARIKCKQWKGQIKEPLCDFDSPRFLFRDSLHRRRSDDSKEVL